MDSITRPLNNRRFACKCDFCQIAAETAKLYTKPKSDLLEVGVPVKKCEQSEPDCDQLYSLFIFLQCQKCGTLWVEWNRGGKKEYILLSKDFNFISLYNKGRTIKADVGDN